MIDGREERKKRYLEEKKGEKKNVGRKEGRNKVGQTRGAGGREKTTAEYSHLEAYPSIIYGDVSCAMERGEREEVPNRRVKLCLHQSEIQPRFGKAASGFIFLSFVFTSVNVAPRFPTFSRIKEKREVPLSCPLFYSTGFSRKAEKTSLRARSPVLCSNMYYHSRVSLLRQRTNSDTLE